MGFSGDIGAGLDVDGDNAGNFAGGRERSLADTCDIHMDKHSDHVGDSEACGLHTAERCKSITDGTKVDGEEACDIRMSEHRLLNKDSEACDIHTTEPRMTQVDCMPICGGYTRYDMHTAEIRTLHGDSKVCNNRALVQVYVC